MIKDALEKVISEDLSEIWTLLDGDEKRKIIDSFTLHHFKKNQIIYAEHEEPEYLWCLLKGKAKLHKDGVGGRQQILRLIRFKAVFWLPRLFRWRAIRVERYGYGAIRSRSGTHENCFRPY